MSSRASPCDDGNLTERSTVRCARPIRLLGGYHIVFLRSRSSVTLSAWLTLKRIEAFVRDQCGAVTDKQPETSTPPSHLVVTAGRVVNIQRVGERTRVRAEVLGAVPDGYIALREACSSPESRVLRLLSLRVADLLILRFLHEGVVYGFRTAVSRLVTDPEHLVFVHYPRLVEHVSVRREPRTACCMPCRVAYDGSGPQPGLMLDVSAAGCRIVGQFEREEAAPSAGCQVTVILALPDRTEPFQALGVVRRLDRDEEWVLGIAFDQEQKELYDALEPYLRLAPLR